MTKTKPRKIAFLAEAPLRTISKKQAKENALWSKIKKERIEALREKYHGILPCEYCGCGIMDDADAHHNNRDRNVNTLANARILHRLCHTYVTDNNIKNVPDLLEEKL